MRKNSFEKTSLIMSSRFRPVAHVFTVQKMKRINHLPVNFINLLHLKCIQIPVAMSTRRQLMTLIC